MRVVIFDDVLFHRQREYDGLGLELRFFEHADDALEVVETEQPGLVLMDYAMEEHDTGEEAVQRLRRVYPRGALRIIGISSDPDSNQRMVQAGADEAVPKSHLRGYLRVLHRGGPAR